MLLGFKELFWSGSRPNTSQHQKDACLLTRRQQYGGKILNIQHLLRRPQCLNVDIQPMSQLQRHASWWKTDSYKILPLMIALHSPRTKFTICYYYVSLQVVFSFRASSTSRQLGPPWDLLYPRSLLIFSWKSLKTLPSTLPTSNPSCGSDTWMTPLWFGHMAETHSRIFYYLNQQHPSIKFTMETEEDHKIAFLDVGISRNPDGSLHHNVYRKPTHTDRYLNQRSFHHPSIKSSVNRTLVQRAYNFVTRTAFQWTKAHPNYTRSAQRSRFQTPKARFDVSQTTTHPPTSRHRCVSLSPSKLQGLLHTHKDKPDLTTERESTGSPVSAVRCTSGKLNATSPPDWRNTEHDGRRGDFEKSAIVKHSHIKDHQIDWQQPNSSHPSTHGTPDASERPRDRQTRHCATGHRLFHQRHWRPILQTEGSSISKVHNPHQTEGSSIS